MTHTINTTPPSGALRMHMKTSQPKTSTNSTFQQQFGKGLKVGVQAGSNAVGNIIRPLPGGAALAASVSDMASNLDNSRIGGGLNPSSSVGGGVGSLSTDGDTNGLQDDLVKRNQDMLDQQMRVSHITTIYNAKSNLIKALFDVLKTIGSNIR